MMWIKRFSLALPFAISFVLTVLVAFGDSFHLRMERIAGYGFAFGTPWAWLLDRGWFGVVHNQWLDSVLVYAVVLWIPALLYSTCLWLLFRLLSTGKALLAPGVDRDQPSR